MNANNPKTSPLEKKNKEHQKLGESASRTAEHRLGSDRLLHLQDVVELLGVSPVTASRIMHETGHAIVIRRKLYVFESALLAFVKDSEVA